MKNILLFLSLSLLFVGCGTAHVEVLSVDSQFKPYLNEFEGMSKVEGTQITTKNLIIQMVPSIDDTLTVGYCETADGQTPKIVVSQAWWTNLSDYEKEMLMFHELGHCLLNRNHRATAYLNMPYSVMTPMLFNTSVYQANFTQYMFELFHSQDLATALPLKVSGSTYFNPTAELAPANYVLAQPSDKDVVPEEGEEIVNPNLPHCTEEHMHGHQ